MTVKYAYQLVIEKINHLYGLPESSSIAAIVMEDAFGIKYAKINNGKILNDIQQKKITEIIDRLHTYEPVQYVLGKTIFYGLPFKVDENVLIPRQETEELVAWVLETERSVRRLPSAVCRLLDIGTGSGCIPVALKHKLPGIEMHALDVSKGALNIAKENAALNNTEIIFHEMDILNEMLWPQLPDYDVVVSNPPYITTDEKNILEKNVIEYEPHLALFSGNNDAQRFIKKITAFAKKKLNINGFLFFETNEFYAAESKKIMEGYGFTEVEIREDLNGKNRMLCGRWGKDKSW